MARVMVVYGLGRVLEVVFQRRRFTDFVFYIELYRFYRRFQNGSMTAEEFLFMMTKGQEVV